MRHRLSIDLTKALFISGMTTVGFGVTTLLLSAVLYGMKNDGFSIFSTYLSDFGSSGGWSEKVFNSGLLLLGPVRLLFFTFLIYRLSVLGMSRGLKIALLSVAALVTLGGIGVPVIPYRFNETGHMIAAVTYYGSMTLFQSMLFVYEIRKRVRILLPASGLLVASTSFIFMLLLSQFGIHEKNPSEWEWMSFLALALWILSHSLVLRRHPKGYSILAEKIP